MRYLLTSMLIPLLFAVAVISSGCAKLAMASVPPEPGVWLASDKTYANPLTPNSPHKNPFLRGAVGYYIFGDVWDANHTTVPANKCEFRIYTGSGSMFMDVSVRKVQKKTFPEKVEYPKWVPDEFLGKTAMLRIKDWDADMSPKVETFDKTLSKKKGKITVTDVVIHGLEPGYYVFTFEYGGDEFYAELI